MDKIFFSLGVMIFLAGCSSSPPRPPGTEPPFDAGRNSEIPMTHQLTSNDWETLDSLWGLNAPARNICVYMEGFKLRVLKGPVSTSENSSPVCVNYGGFSSLVTHTVQVKGTSGAMVYFIQSAGSR